MRSRCRPQPGTVFVAVLHLACLLPVASLWAQTEVANRAASPSLSELQTKAARIAESYGQLEQLILRMAEIETLTNPERAALLKRAAQQSAERRTRKQLDDTITLLAPPAKLKLAIDEQERGLVDLKSLLELLLSEDRADRLKAEETRIREYIKEVERLIRLQRSAEGRTRGGADPQKLADEQERLAARTGELAEDMRRTEEGGQSADENSAEGSPTEAKDESQPGAKPEPAGDQPTGKPAEQPEKDADADPAGDDKKPAGSESQPQDKPGTPAKDPGGEEKQPGGDSKSEGQPQEGKPAEKPAEGQPQEGTPPGDSSPSDPSDDQPPSSENPNPARQRLQAAEQRMREAQKRLEEAKRDEAVDEQEKARHELEQAKAELEEILRQLRQEEVGRTLALLEGRFRRMLEKQVHIYEATQRLDKISPDARDRQVDIQASKLGFDETKLAIEADKALLLLHEEGSSVAFPETVELLRDDMQDVADRLAAANIGAITQGIEEEIIAALEEMIEALQQAQQDLEDKKQQQQQQQQGQPREPGDEPLVDKIAELKMIRALQMRVNTRTTHYSRLLQDADDLIGQAEDQELRESLRKLSGRQERIHEVTRDIVLGKNQ